jgi:hypothetical protein
MWVCKDWLIDIMAHSIQVFKNWFNNFFKHYFLMNVIQGEGTSAINFFLGSSPDDQETLL